MAYSDTARRARASSFRSSPIPTAYLLSRDRAPLPSDRRCSPAPLPPRISAFIYKTNEEGVSRPARNAFFLETGKRTMPEDRKAAEGAEKGRNCETESAAGYDTSRSVFTTNPKYTMWPIQTTVTMARPTGADPIIAKAKAKSSVTGTSRVSFAFSVMVFLAT